MISFRLVMVTASLQEVSAPITALNMWVQLSFLPLQVSLKKLLQNLLRDLKITGIACTPSYALYVADAMDKHGMTKDDICLKIGAFGAETWTEKYAKR